MRTNWGYRSACMDCNICELSCHLDDSDFRSRQPCPKCGFRMKTVLCRFVREPEFNLFSPSTWFGCSWKIETK